MIVLEDPGNYLRWLPGIYEKVGEDFEQVHESYRKISFGVCG
jgi:hypothetical protein